MNPGLLVTIPFSPPVKLTVSESAGWCVATFVFYDTDLIPWLGRRDGLALEKGLQVLPPVRTLVRVADFACSNLQIRSYSDIVSAFT